MDCWSNGLVEYGVVGRWISGDLSMFDIFASMTDCSNTPLVRCSRLTDPAFAGSVSPYLCSRRICFALPLPSWNCLTMPYALLHRLDHAIAFQLVNFLCGKSNLRENFPRVFTKDGSTGAHGVRENFTGAPSAFVLPRVL
jgi:hypothetical protein